MKEKKKGKYKAHCTLLAYIMNKIHKEQMSQTMRNKWQW